MKTRITSKISRIFKHFVTENRAMSKQQLLACLCLALLPTTVLAAPPPVTQDRYLYMADPVGLQILAYKITPVTGVLVPLACSPIADLNKPVTLTVDRDGAFLYVADALPAAAPTINTYPINLATGCLGAPVAVGPPMAPGATAVQMELTAHDMFLYVSDSFNNVVWAYVNFPAGTLALIGPFPAGAPVEGLAVDMVGSYLYVADNAAVGPIQQSTYGPGGVPGPFAPFPSTPNPFEMAIDTVGQCLHVTNNPGNTLTSYSIGPGGVIGAPSSINVTGAAGANPWGVGVDVQDQLVYVANNGANSVTGFLIDPANCKLAPVNAPYALGVGALAPEGLAVDPTGRFVYVADSNGFISGYTINEKTGKLVGIAPFPLPAGLGPTVIAIQP
jgi:6-phosphogluconolactonase